MINEERLKDIDDRASMATPGPLVWAPSSIGGGLEQVRPDGTMYEQRLKVDGGFA